MHSHWPIRTVPYVLASACVMLAFLAVSSWSAGPAEPPAAAAAGAGFVVPRDGAPRFSGPRGREADITQVVMTREQTGGAVGLIYQSIPPKGGPPAHTHRGEDEFFFIVSGEFKFLLGDRVVNASAGSFVFVPRNEVHAFRNVGGDHGVIVAGITPAGFEQFFVERQGADTGTIRMLAKKYGMDVVGPPLQ